MSLARRMNNEQKSWNKKISAESHIYIVYEVEKREVLVSVYKRRLKRVIFFKLELGWEYPFSPPKCELSIDLKKWNNMYQYFFNITNQSIKNWRHKNGAACPCCMSLLCSQNWGPMNNILEIGEELSKHIDEKLELMEKLYVDIIIRKNAGKLPDAMIEYIKEFI
jgi:ubiquitin-protein ligase